MQYRTALPSALKRTWALGLVSALVAALAVSAPGLRGREASASSHREAPLIAADPQHDNTDLYAFVSPDKPDTVTFVANWIPFEEPNGGPNFYPFAAGSHSLTAEYGGTTTAPGNPAPPPGNPPPPPGGD